MRFPFIVVVLWCLVGVMAAVDGPTAMAKVREQLVEIGYPDAATIPLKVDTSWTSSFKIQVGKVYAKDWWGVYPEPLLYVTTSDGRVQQRFYSFTCPDKELPDPKTIYSGLCMETKTPADQARAVKGAEMILRWFDVHRNDEAYGISFAYDSFVRAFKAAGREKDLPQMLAKELEKATGPMARYEIMHQQACILRDAKKLVEAEKLWREAGTMMAGAGNSAWFTTRASLPLLEVAKMHAGGDKTKAMQAYADYFALEMKLKGGEASAVLAYADLLVSAKKRTDAVAICTRWIEIQDGFPWANEQVKQRIVGTVKTKLEQIRR